MNVIEQILSRTDSGRKAMASARLRREVLVALDAALKDSGLSQSALAKRMGKTRSAVSQVFGGDGNIRVETLAEYLFAMGKELELEALPIGEPDARVETAAYAAAAERAVAADGFSVRAHFELSVSTDAPPARLSAVPLTARSLHDEAPTIMVA